MSIGVVIVDDHEMLSQSLSRFLSGEPDIMVRATATSVAEGIAAVGRFRPDIAVVDFRLPDGDGATAAREIIDLDPHVRVIMLSDSESESTMFDAVASRCSGFVSKVAPPGELLRVVRSVAGGGYEFPRAVMDGLPGRGELVVHYQPVMNLLTGQLEGFEALVRWLHPSRGLILPGEFISLAEKTGLILDIDDQVRDVACRQAREWAGSYGSERVKFMSVNVSARQFSRPDLTSKIAATLRDTGLEPDRLMIEITETYLLGDSDDNVRAVDQLKDIGVRVALDDFGTGYSSLSYLRRFPIDVIKLDKSFTQEIPQDGRGRRLLESVGRLAADLGATPEAEGIETETQAKWLQTMGWPLGQGFYFSRPVDSDSATKMLSDVRLSS